MRGLLRPVGTEPARVYWVRRLVVLAVAIILVVGLIFLITKLIGGSADPEPQPTPAAEQQELQPAPDTPCGPEDLALEMIAGPDSVAAGSEATFEVSVTNNGENACTVDVGDESRVMTITSGDDRIWSSKDCASADDASRLVLLRSGSDYTDNAVWDGARSDAECSEDLPAPLPGTYQLQIEIAGTSAQEHRFTIS